jgi:hypothetical protein
MTWSRALQIVAVLAVAIAGVIFVNLALLGTSVSGDEPVGKLSPRANLAPGLSEGGNVPAATTGGAERVDRDGDHSALRVDD